MRQNFFFIALPLLLLAGCSPPEMPASPTAAREQIEGLGARVQVRTEQVQAGAQRAREIFGRAGDVAQVGVDAARTGFTAVGDTVLTATGYEDLIQAPPPPAKK